jgi:hypothetical protein
MAPSDASRETLHSHAEERERAIALATSGAYNDWHAVCRKMLFDGWDVEIFMDTDFISGIDRICAENCAR